MMTSGIRELLTANNVIGAGFFVSGCYGLLILLLLLRKARAVWLWPDTRGRILESSVRGHWSTGAETSLWIETPRVSYTYEVKGKVYVGHARSLTLSSTSSREYAECKIKPYPVG